MEVYLASLITEAAELRHLGTIGLDVPANIIDGALNNKKGEITEAAAVVIKNWGFEQEDKEKAFKDLCKILREIKRLSYIGPLKNIKEVKNYFGDSLS